MEASVIDSLLAANTFQVPGFMVDNLSRDYEKRLEEDEPSPETLRSVRELAERKVREFLLLRQIAIHENVEVDGEELEKAAAGGSGLPLWTG
jgi:FKBP-type peptidyl-prolyl cis-trans isomerase (trigger factor)